MAGTLDCACTHTPRALSHPPAAADFEASIAALGMLDGSSPAALETRLEYADFLIEHDARACGERLDLAQSLLNFVTMNPATAVLFPNGWVRTADLDYRIHRDRSTCNATDATRKHELALALDAMQRAVQLYRDAFDYASMAVAQFNVAATHRELGHDAEAIAALDKAIQMDWEFGLRDDAEDNYQSLLTWRNQPAGPDQVAQLMQDFPNRTLSLKFAWASSDATLTSNDNRVKLVDDRLLKSQVSRRFERRVLPQTDGWVVAFTSDDAAADFGVWPDATGENGGPSSTFAPSLAKLPTFAVTRSGDFQSVSDLAVFSSAIKTESQAEIRQHAPPGSRSPRLVDDALQATDTVFSPNVIEELAAENYALQTAMWIGATLQQGVHYQLVAPLALIDIPQVVIDNRLDFYFARELPCSEHSAQPDCVELIVHASPVSSDVQQAIGRVRFAGGATLRYSSSASIRIIVDPKTLQPHLRDTQSYLYVTLGKRSAPRVLVESERTLLKLNYRPSQVAP